MEGEVNTQTLLKKTAWLRGDRQFFYTYPQFFTFSTSKTGLSLSKKEFLTQIFIKMNKMNCQYLWEVH